MEKTRLLLLTLTVLLMLLFSACAPKAAVSPAPAPAPASVAPAQEAPKPVQASWEREWERTLAAAKKEGSVVVAGTAGGPVRSALVGEFKKAQGISVEWISGRGVDTSEKLFAERRAGLYLADVYIGGSGTSLTSLKPAGVFQPLEPALILPEVLDPKVWRGGKLGWIDEDHQNLSFLAFAVPPILINTTMVGPDEIKSYRDLLAPKWKGKIVMYDPTSRGLGGKWATIAGSKIIGWDYLRQLAKQEPAITTDRRLQVEWVARGKHAIGIAAESPPIAEFQKVGAPIKRLTPVEGTISDSGSGTLAFIDRAPHPNASKVFINWLLTKEGQTVASPAFGSPSRRVDVDTSGHDPSMLLDPNIQYYPGDDEKFLQDYSKLLETTKEIFGHLIGK